MLCVCVGDVMDVVFSVCIVRRGAVGAMFCRLIRKLNKTTCVSDPFPTKLLMSHISSIIYIILCIVNHRCSSGVFQHLVSPPSFSFD